MNIFILYNFIETFDLTQFEIKIKIITTSLHF